MLFLECNKQPNLNFFIGKVVKILINAFMFEQAIKSAGLKKAFLAEQLGVTIQAFRLKVRGKSDFKCSELQKIKVILNLSDEEFMRIFFSENR